jgi:O-antigen/teichoic acid export membrane protein
MSPSPTAAGGPPPSQDTRARGAATVASDLLSQSSARLITAMLSIISVVITTRLLLPRQYSVLAYIWVISSLVLTASCAWTSAALGRLGREELDATGRMRETSWARMIIATPILAIACAAVLVLHAVGALPADFRIGYALLAIASGLIAVAGDQLTTLLWTAGRMKLAALLGVLSQGAAVGGVAVLAAAGLHHPLAAVALIAVLSNIVLVIPALAVLWLPALWPPAIPRAAIARMLHFSWPLIAFAVSGYVVQSVDIVILRHYDTATATGVYAVAYGAYAVLQAAAATITVVLTPLFVSLRSAGREDLVRRFADRGIAQFTLAASTAIGVAMCIVPLAITLVYGPRFRGAGHPLIVLCGALLLFAQASALAPVLVLYERTRPIGVINVCAAVLNIVGDIVLVGYVHIGVMGPAVATCAAVACIAIGYIVVATRAVEGRLRSLHVLMFAPAAIGMALSLELTKGIVTDGASALAVIAVGLAILRTSGAVDVTDLELFARLDIPAGVRRRLLRGVARVSGVDRPEDAVVEGL